MKFVFNGYQKVSFENFFHDLEESAKKYKLTTQATSFTVTEMKPKHKIVRPKNIKALKKKCDVMRRSLRIANKKAK